MFKQCTDVNIDLVVTDTADVFPHIGEEVYVVIKDSTFGINSIFKVILTNRTTEEITLKRVRAIV